MVKRAEAHTLADHGARPADQGARMECPVCHQDGADHQQVGPAVTVFCCPDCLNSVLRTFASHKQRDKHVGVAPVRAQSAAFH